MKYEILKLREHPELKQASAEWFHLKWGIPVEMLDCVCMDMQSKGIEVLYLVTDHTSFYERYGWEFLCMVQGDGEPDMTRMYIHRMG